jgi:hypothetical protein
VGERVARKAGSPWRYCQPSPRTNSLRARDGLVGPDGLLLRRSATGVCDVSMLHNRGLVRDDQLQVT